MKGSPAVKLSARNQIKGVIKSVTKGQTTAHVQIDIGGVVVSASITNEAVDELKLVLEIAELSVPQHMVKRRRVTQPAMATYLHNSATDVTRLGRRV